MKIDWEDLSYLVGDVDRHGNRRIYVRLNGRKVRLRKRPGSVEFVEEYKQGLEQLRALGRRVRPRRNTQPPHGSLGWLATQYFASAEFRGSDEKSELRNGLDPASQRNRRAIIEESLREPLKPNSKDTMRMVPLRLLSSQHMIMLRDRKTKAALPGAANNRLKYFSAMFGWAVEHGHMTSNPVREVKNISYASDGFHTWTEAEIQQFEEFYPVGTKARLAMSLILYSGSRGGDAYLFGPQHIRNGWLEYVPAKTDYVRADISAKPVLPVLTDAIAGSQIGAECFLLNEYGRPFTKKGFENRFKKWCAAARLPHCTPHGLKKAAATRCAEAGATEYQMMTLFDWTTPNQARKYIQAANRRKLASDAMHLMAIKREGAIVCPTPSVPPTKSLKDNDVSDGWQEWRDSNPQPPVLETGALAS